MNDILWKDISSAPKGGKVFIAKNQNVSTVHEFYCHYAPTPDGLGYYAFLELGNPPYYEFVRECRPTHWREKD